jgi:hypothetical protein
MPPSLVLDGILLDSNIIFEKSVVDVSTSIIVVKDSTIALKGISILKSPNTPSTCQVQFNISRSAQNGDLYLPSILTRSRHINFLANQDNATLTIQSILYTPTLIYLLRGVNVKTLPGNYAHYTNVVRPGVETASGTARRKNYPGGSRPAPRQLSCRRAREQRRRPQIGGSFVLPRRCSYCIARKLVIDEPVDTGWSAVKGLSFKANGRIY